MKTTNMSKRFSIWDTFLNNDKFKEKLEKLRKENAFQKANNALQKEKNQASMKIIKKKTLKTNKLTLVKPKKNTPAYYHCLASKATHGLKPGITACCKECKEQSTNIALNRQQEIKKLSEAYKQIGVSLTKLLCNK